MEHISSEVHDALAEKNWEDRLKEARAQREANLRAKAAEGADEWISSDVHETLPKGSWEDRLNEARAKREAILRARAADGGNKSRSSLDRPPTRGFAMASVLRQFSINSSQPSKEEARVAAHFIPNRLAKIGLGFGIGIGIGIGVTAAIVMFQIQRLDREPLAMEQEPVAAPLQESASEILLARPNAAAQTLAVPETSPPPLQSPVALAELGVNLVPPAQLSLPDLPKNSGNAAGDSLEFGAPSALLLDASPKDALPSRLTEQVTTAPSRLVPTGPVALADLGVSIAPPGHVSLPDVPWKSRNAAGASLDFAAPSALLLDASPNDGTAPRLAAQVTAAPSRVVLTDLVHTAASLRGLNLDANDTDVGSINLVAANGSFGAAAGIGSFLREARPLPAVVDSAPVNSHGLIANPERPEFMASLDVVPPDVAPATETGIAFASIGNDLLAYSEPEPLTRPSPPGIASAADLSPPEPVVPSAADMALWIFAASTVNEDSIETAVSTVERFDMPVRAVNRVRYRISKNQVRFYDATSAAVANRLAAEIGAVPRDFTRSNVNPPPGTLEIYLAGEAARTMPRRQVTNANTPSRRQQPSQADRRRDNVISKLRAGWSN